MCETNEMREKIDDLEIKVAFQEDLLSKLDQVVTSQQQQLLSLESKVTILLRQLKELDQGQQQSDDEPPPHY